MAPIPIITGIGPITTTGGGISPSLVQIEAWTSDRRMVLEMLPDAALQLAAALAPLVRAFGSPSGRGII